MTNIIYFAPKAEATAEDNLALFIDACRPLLKGYRGVKSWDQNDWDLIGIVDWEGRGRGRIAAVFSDFEASTRNGVGAMSSPFLDFAKAYFLYTQALRPTKAFFQRLAALRALEKALKITVGSSKVDLITAAIFNIADNFVREHFGEGAGYRVGRELAVLSGFISEKHLVAVPFQWESSIPRPKERNRIGAEADRARETKLPSESALEALPKCFLDATESIDVLVSSVAALLCTAPDRISEVFKLPVDCEVEQEFNGKHSYGLRWWPGKGADPMIKWIAPTMVEVAKEAIAKLRIVTQPARDVAEWYEANPTKMFIVPEMEHLRLKEYLSMSEVASLIGLSGISSPYNFIRSSKIPLRSPDDKSEVSISFYDLERFVVGLLPEGFPIFDPVTGLQYSRALLVIRHNELKVQKSTWHCLVDPVGTAQINDGLGARIQHGVPSLFSRMGFTEPDGGPIKMTTHQFRHWLNTLAHRGGMSQLDIAKWSGRKDVRQNLTYDHMSGDEFMVMTRELTKDDPRIFGSLAELAAKAPVSRDEFMQLEFPTAHVTDIGFCVHDYTMLPCQQHRDCINCNESICVKGDHHKTKRIRLQLDIAEDQLIRAQAGMQEGYFGAERWFDHHSATVKRLRELLKILEDPKIPEGALIRVYNPNEHTPILMAVRDRDRNLQSEPTQDFRGILPMLTGGE